MCFGGGGADFPDPPDLSGLYESINRQTALMERLGERSLDFQETVYNDQKALLDDIVAIQLPLMEEQADWAREFNRRYQENFAPIEDALADMAATYDTPERREAEAARAMQDVRMTYEGQRQRARDELINYGIDPSQIQSQALDTSVRTAEAAAGASAANLARQRVEDVGRGLQFNVANLGRGFPGNTAQFTQGAVGTGATIAGQQTAQANAFLPYAGNPLPYYQTAINANLGVGGLQNDIYGNQIRGYGAQQAYGGSVAEGFGQLAGTALGIWGGRGFPTPFQEGGVVPEPNGAIPAENPSRPAAMPTDRTAAALTPGEYVVPADVVRWKGEEFFARTEAKAREDRTQAIDTQRQEQAAAIAAQPRPATKRPVANVSRNVSRLERMRGTPTPAAGGAIPAAA